MKRLLTPDLKTNLPISKVDYIKLKEILLSSFKIYQLDIDWLYCPILVYWNLARYKIDPYYISSKCLSFIVLLKSQAMEIYVLLTFSDHVWGLMGNVSGSSVDQKNLPWKEFVLYHGILYIAYIFPVQANLIGFCRKKLN